FRPTELISRVAASVKLRRMTAERSELYELGRRQRDDLLRLQLQKEQLVAFLVHDLKNPVNAIELHGQRILRDRDASERSRDAALEIRIRDRGMGIPPELREHLFDRFVQGNRPLAARGHGLGLAFCKLAVEAHGGRIWIESADPGTIFCLRISDV